ncbi:family 43 glycosylhydrolase [Flagellimonas sp.]|uniref:family 43 glycosylhydrolase n=1 Tax=Flagellimonas sp. TaxID=2058762 RepID=UPI003B502794
MGLDTIKWIFQVCCLTITAGASVHAQNKTYCNPIDIDYTYMIYDAHKNISYRSGADPAVVGFKDEYYMFVTRSLGYWHSKDLHQWEFIRPQKWYFQGSNAPAAFNYKDSLLYVAGNPSGNGSILYTADPQKGDWRATPSIVHGLQDPSLFINDDETAYLYWGSSNTYPIRVNVLDKKKRFKPSEKTHELFKLYPEKHGWERFGENHSDTLLTGYIEGPWMTKHRGKYYLQYAAPGTEFNVYGDGAYIGNSPLGPFRYMPNSPFSYKPGGFINGAGHGSTVEGPGNQFWHFATMALNVNIGWERRIGMFPTFFDEEGLIYCDTRFGDYPHYSPSLKEKKGAFVGWMLLSYKKPVKVSSQHLDFGAEQLVDENVKTFWVAEKNNTDQWIELDLEQPAMVYSLQVNYNDYKSGMFGRLPDLYHQYIIETSITGKSWSTLIDKSKTKKDSPNDYVELPSPKKLRYLRFKNVHTPTPYLSISDIRVFGKGFGKPPKKVKKLSVLRKDDRRDARVLWQAVPNAQGYNVFWGIAADKLYNTWLIYDDNSLELKSLNTDQSYYFSVEAFNENGISEMSEIVSVN